MLTRGQRPLETHADDLTAVLDDLGSRRAALFAVQESASIAMLAAASYPQRVSKLIVMNTSATWSTTDETPWEWSDDEWEVELRLQRTWGSRSWAVGWAQTQAPALLGDERAMDWLTTMFRMTCGPEEAVPETRLWLRYDQRPIMSAIHTPTLVLRRSAEDATSSAEAARYLEEHIPDARYEELPGDGAADPTAGAIAIMLFTLFRVIEGSIFGRDRVASSRCDRQEQEPSRSCPNRCQPAKSTLWMVVPSHHLH